MMQVRLPQRCSNGLRWSRAIPDVASRRERRIGLRFELRTGSIVRELRLGGHLTCKQTLPALAISTVESMLSFLSASARLASSTRCLAAIRETRVTGHVVMAVQARVKAYCPSRVVIYLPQCSSKPWSTLMQTDSRLELSIHHR